MTKTAELPAPMIEVTEARRPMRRDLEHVTLRVEPAQSRSSQTVDAATKCESAA